MNTKTNINFDDLYNEIHDLRGKLDAEPKDPKRWWNFIKDINFWLSVIKIIFKYFFK